MLDSLLSVKKEAGASGEVTSLAGNKNLAAKFGDRCAKGTIDKSQLRRSATKKRRKDDATDVLSLDLDFTYRPRFKETKEAYRELLSYIMKEMEHGSHELLRSGADEVLSVLKDDSLTPSLKKKNVGLLFHKAIEEAQFAVLLGIAAKITDFKQELGEPSVDEEEAISVVLDDEPGDPHLPFLSPTPVLRM